MDKPEKAELKSMDVAEDKRRQLAQFFPEVVTEARTPDGQLTRAVDFEKLKAVLGTFSEVLENQKERYGMTWPGKNECLKIIQQPSIATLKPCREESVNFDTTENLFIEGDNLEVLKLLQKAYYGKVKMIYIDPPYNTGKEFIYPDKYSESLDTYLAYTGQVDAEGRKFSANTEDSGRYHSTWLKMMYPRLYLAGNLLRDDGVIFISIDDNEVKNLRAICDEIFGPENFVATVIWQKVFSPKNTAMYFSEDHDYVLVYARNKELWRPYLLPRSEENTARYSNPDNDPRGVWMSGALQARNYYSKGQYEVMSPSGKRFSNPKGTYWRYSKERFHELDQDKRIWWGEDGSNVPRLKRFLTDVKKGVIPQTLWPYSDVGHTQGAKEELLKYVEFEETENVLNSVKPTKLLQRMLEIGTEKDSEDIILDFFAGSGPTAHAVLTKNRTDGGNRRFILVQLPEPLPKEERTVKTIADLAKSRIRNVGKEIESNREGELVLGGAVSDIGFRVYKLARSNFKIWDSEQAAKAPEAIFKQLELHEQHIDPKAGQQDILYELLLKAGFPLTTKIEKLYLKDGKLQKEKPQIDTDQHGSEKKSIGVHPCSSVVPSIFSVADGALLICLEREITKELIKVMADADPLQVICLDEGFKANDQLKANAVQTFKARSQGKDKEAGIVFRTV